MLKTGVPNPGPVYNIALAIDLFVLLVLFGVAVRHSDDACMANAQLGLNLTWWTGINCFVLFVLLICAAFVLSPLYVAAVVGWFLVPWHVIGFILFLTSQNSCVVDGHAVGVAAVFIFVVDVAVILFLLYTYLNISYNEFHNRNDVPMWRKASVYILAIVGLASLIGLSIGSSNLNDSCLTPDPSGVNLAQWILTLSTVTFGFFLVMLITGAVVKSKPMLRNMQCCEHRGTDPNLGQDWDKAATYLTALWAVFLIVWVPFGIFLVSTTQAACFTDNAQLSVGFIFSMMLPIAAVYIINKKTKSLFAFSK